GGPMLAAQPDALMHGTEAGAQLGAALAIGDLDGDGADDLVVGAPGAGGTRGAIFVFYGGATWPASLDAKAGAQVAVATGGKAGEGAAYLLADASAMGARTVGEGGGFGTSVGFADLDGSGKPQLIVAAPEEDAGTVFFGQPAAVDATTPRLRASSPLGGLGSALARVSWPRGDALVVGAPSSLGTAPGAG